MCVQSYWEQKEDTLPAQQQQFAIAFFAFESLWVNFVTVQKANLYPTTVLFNGMHAKKIKVAWYTRPV